MQIRRLSSAEADFQKKFSELVAVDASVDPEITRRAEAIVDDVRERGDAAVLEYTARFDRLPAEKLSDLVITAEEMRQALETLPEEQRTALEEAAPSACSTKMSSKRASRFVTNTATSWVSESRLSTLSVSMYRAAWQHTRALF